MFHQNKMKIAEVFKHDKKKLEGTSLYMYSRVFLFREPCGSISINNDSKVIIAHDKTFDVYTRIQVVSLNSWWVMKFNVWFVASVDSSDRTNIWKNLRYVNSSTSQLLTNWHIREQSTPNEKDVAQSVWYMTVSTIFLYKQWWIQDFILKDEDRRTSSFLNHCHIVAPFSP